MTTTVVSPDWERKLLLKDKQAGTEGNLAEKPQQTLVEPCNLGIITPPQEEPKPNGKQENDAPDVFDGGSLWWRGNGAISSVRGIMCNAGAIATSGVNVAGSECEALLDSGASRS